MLQLDEFESVFRAAAKTPYEPGVVRLDSVLVVSDLPAEPTRLLERDVRGWLSEVAGEGVSWARAGQGDFDGAVSLLEQVEQHRPDLICTYRNLFGRAKGLPFSLGAHVDVLTQATTTPVLLLPEPTDEGRIPGSVERLREVLVLTDHLTGSHHLVDEALRFTPADGLLLLAHLEDDATFARYMDVISKLPSIDTDTARRDLSKQLLAEPADYIESISEALKGVERAPRIESVVRMGHRVADVQRLVGEHAVDLVVMNTKDEDQLAMHGLAYPLAIELRDTPLLLV